MFFNQDKSLFKIKKEWGTNGFYNDENGKEFFIKKPKNRKKFFTELFAGLLLREFIDRGLVDEPYKASLIHVEFNETYGLIQPKIDFTPLYQLIGTGLKDGSARDPLFEMIAGPSYYPALTANGSYQGLSLLLMFSLLFGDYSVHSGKVVVLNNPGQTIKQFARIDWDSSFRYFAHKDNNNDILTPFEYKKGLINHKWFTKGYLANYKYIAGLFPAVAQKAFSLKLKLNSNPLKQIVSSALSKIPANLLDTETQIKLADYLCIPAFKTACFGPKGEFEPVAETLTEVMLERLDKLCELKDLTMDASAPFYQSTLLDRSEPVNPLSLGFDANQTLVEQFESLLIIFSDYEQVDLSKIDLNQVAIQFNRYLQIIAHQAEIYNLWEHHPHSSKNLFENYMKEDMLLAKYRESWILKRLYTLKPNSIKRSDHEPLKKIVSAYNKNHSNSAWQKIERMFSSGLEVLNSLKEMQQSGQNKKKQAQDLLTQFRKAKEDYQELILSKSKNLKSPPFFESPIFYSFSLAEFKKLNRKQLISLSLEELSLSKQSVLVKEIVKDKISWRKLSHGYIREFDGPKNPLLEAYLEFGELFHLKKRDSAVGPKISRLSKIKQKMHCWPEFLQNDGELKKELDHLEKHLRELPLENYNNCFKNYSSKNTLREKLLAYDELNAAFIDLPVHLRQKFQSEMIRLNSINVIHKELITKKDKKGNYTVNPACAISEIEKILSLPDTNLMEAAIGDALLWGALIKSERRDFPQELINDLLALQKFYQEKLLDKKMEEGDDYNKDIEDNNKEMEQFYAKSLAIRLSNTPIKEQAKKIMQTAHDEFHHRDENERLFADVALLLSVFFAGLGLFIMGGRYVAYGTPWFSDVATSREEDLIKLWMKDNESNGDNLSLFKPIMGT